MARQDPWGSHSSQQHLSNQPLAPKARPSFPLCLKWEFTTHPRKPVGACRLKGKIDFSSPCHRSECHLRDSQDLIDLWQVHGNHSPLLNSENINEVEGNWQPWEGGSASVVEILPWSAWEQKSWECSQLASPGLPEVAWKYPGRLTHNICVFSTPK